MCLRPSVISLPICPSPLPRSSAGASPVLWFADVSARDHQALEASCFLGSGLGCSRDFQFSSTNVDVGALGDSWSGDSWSGELGRA